MIPVDFPETNLIYRPPGGFTETQVVPIPTFRGEAAGGSCDGQMITVVCWRLTPEELNNLVAKQMMLNEPPVIYLTMFGGLAPHMLTTSFAEATHPA